MEKITEDKGIYWDRDPMIRYHSSKYRELKFFSYIVDNNTISYPGFIYLKLHA